MDIEFRSLLESIGISDLDDVTISGAAENDVLQLNASLEWVNSQNLTINGSAQLGNATTDIHGINTAPVSARMLTTSCAATGDDSITGYNNTITQTGNMTTGTASAIGVIYNIDQSGNSTDSGSGGKAIVGIDLDIDSTVNAQAGSYSIRGLRSDINLTLAGSPSASIMDLFGFENTVDSNLGTGGTTTKYGHKITVTGTADNNYGIWMNVSGATANSGIVLDEDSLPIVLGEAQDYSIKWDGSDAVHTITAGDFVFTGGNVGIGTTSPVDKLHILGNNENISIQHTSSAGTESGFLFLRQADGGNQILGGMRYNYDDNALVFSTTTPAFDIEQMRIDSSGNVGIGIINPSAKLQLDSDVNFAHLLTVGTNTLTEGGIVFNTGFSRGSADTSVTLTIVRDFTADVLMGAGVVGDDFRRFAFSADGKMQWGDGANARDTNLYRDSANILKTDDEFRATTVRATTNFIMFTDANGGYQIQDLTTNHNFTGLGGIYGSVLSTTSGVMSEGSPTAGGLNLGSFRDNDGTSMSIQAHVNAASPASSKSAMIFAAYKTNGGTGRSDYTGGAITTFRAGSTERFRIMANGDLHVLGDNDKLRMGATLTDLEIYSDGTNGVIDCATELRIGSDGGATNYSAFEADGTLEFNGTATVWKDINMAGYLLAKPASNFPTVESFVDENGADTGIETYAFAIGKKVHGGFELQHDYKEGTDLVFHVHWQGITAPSGTDNVQWRLNYIVMRDGTTLNAAVEIDSPDSPITNQYSTEKADFVAITGTNFLFEDQFMFTLTRVAATGDVYLGDALIATAGIHYEVDTIGSRTIDTK